MKVLIALALMLAVSACASGAVIDSFCLTNHPRRLSDATISAMSDAEVTAALKFNEYGARRCGWTP